MPSSLSLMSQNWHVNNEKYILGLLTKLRCPQRSNKRRKAYDYICISTYYYLIFLLYIFQSEIQAYCGITFENMQEFRFITCCCQLTETNTPVLSATDSVRPALPSDPSGTRPVRRSSRPVCFRRRSTVRGYVLCVCNELMHLMRNIFNFQTPTNTYLLLQTIYSTNLVFLFL